LCRTKDECDAVVGGALQHRRGIGPHARNPPSLPSLWGRQIRTRLFDVVVCNELPNTELYRLHFPDRKKDAFNFERHPRIRYKKNVKMMEMRLAPDVSSGSFDKEKAERFAAMNLPIVKSENDIAPTKFDEIYEGRSYVRDDYVQFAVGFFRENTFFLSPIAGTFEMHMSLAHLNNATKVNRGASGESDSETSGLFKIRVKFTRLETERQKKRREASALYREKLIASDSWIPMEVHLKEEPLVEEKLAQMTPLSFNESKNFEVLTTRDLVERGIICDEREQVVSVFMRILIVMNGVKNIFVQARVIRTDDIVRLVGSSFTREELFQQLQECARLVQGVWVLKSEFLFHDLTVAHSTTLGKLDEHRAEMWRCARDLSLCILDFGQPVTRALLIKCFKINSKDAEDILSTFAVPGDKTWKLRIAPDPVFSERYLTNVFYDDSGSGTYR
uniref:DNA-directed RNA polymerase III subunit RPC5 n=1 Tax=Angiostrongylus costaricensis TaxID=334426 RepID=A0A0R3PSK2_ANGCS